MQLLITQFQMEFLTCVSVSCTHVRVPVSCACASFLCLCQFLVRVPVSCACASFLYMCLSLALSGNHSTLHFYLFGFTCENFSAPHLAKFQMGSKCAFLRDKVDISNKPNCLLDPILWCSLYEVLFLNGLLSPQ